MSGMAQQTELRPGFGVMLHTYDPLRQGMADVSAMARVVEDAGFDSLWVGDHLAFHAPIMEATVAMAAAATATRRIALGFGVFILALRPLAWAAKQLGSLQVLSGDRLILGVGIGGENPAEWEAAGVPLDVRARRTDAALTELPRLLTGVPGVDPVTGAAIPSLEPYGRCPPIWVGGRRDAALRRAARFGDGWMGIWIDPERARRSSELLAEFAVQAGRPMPSVGAIVFATVDKNVRRAREQAQSFLEGQYGLPFDKVERWVAYGDVSSVAAYLRLLVDAGVEHFTMISAGNDPRAQYEALASVSNLVSW